MLPGSNPLQLELPVRIQYLPGLHAGKFLGDVV
jgi:hypothetical protein